METKSGSRNNYYNIEIVQSIIVLRYDKSGRAFGEYVSYEQNPYCIVI